MIAEFIHFYPGYTMETVLKEYSVRFYALLTAMYRLKADERIQETRSRAASRSPQIDDYLAEQRRLAGGGHAILEEVRIVKQAQKKNVN